MTLIRKPKPDGRKSGAYIGYGAMAQLLVVLKEPQTAISAAEITGVHPLALKPLFKQFMALNLLDRVGWNGSKRGFASPIYRIGTGQRYPAPIMRNGQPQTHADHMPPLRPRVVAFASIVHALQQGPSPISEICHQSGVQESNLRPAMRALHKGRLIYRAAYERLTPRASISTLWAWGSGPDAKRPPKKARVYVTAATTKAPRSSWTVAVAALKRQAGIARPSCREIAQQPGAEMQP
jgi:hypothetical protein